MRGASGSPWATRPAEPWAAGSARLEVREHTACGLHREDRHSTGCGHTHQRHVFLLGVQKIYTLLLKKLWNNKLSGPPPGCSEDWDSSCTAQVACLLKPAACVRGGRDLTEPYSHSSRTGIRTMWPCTHSISVTWGGGQETQILTLYPRPTKGNPGWRPQHVSTSPQVVRTRWQGGEARLGRGLRSAWAGSAWVFHSSERPRLHLRHPQVSKPRQL